MLDNYTYQQIADIFNERSEFKPGKASRFNRTMINRIQKDYGLKSRYDRLRAAGMLTQKEVAQLLGISTQTVCRRWKHGLLKRYPYNDKQEYLYEHPGPANALKTPASGFPEERQPLQSDNHRSNEVQCEA